MLRGITLVAITTGLLLALACSSTPSVTVEEYGAMTDNEVTAHIQDCGEHWEDEVYDRTVSRVHEIYPGIELASRDEARFESRTNHTEGRLEVRVFIDQVGKNIIYDGSIDIDLFNCGDPISGSTRHSTRCMRSMGSRQAHVSEVLHVRGSRT